MRTKKRKYVDSSGGQFAQAFAMDVAWGPGTVTLYEIQALTSSEVFWPECYKSIHRDGRIFLLSEGYILVDGGSRQQKGLIDVDAVQLQNTRPSPDIHDLLIMDSSAPKSHVPTFPGTVLHHNWFVKLLCENKAVSRFVVDYLMPALNPRYLYWTKDQPKLTKQALRDDLGLLSSDDPVLFIKNPRSTKGRGNLQCKLSELPESLDEFFYSGVLLVELATGCRVAGKSACSPRLFSYERYQTGRVVSFCKGGQDPSLALAYTETHPDYDSHHKSSILKQEKRRLKEGEAPNLRDLVQEISTLNPMQWLRWSMDKAVDRSEHTKAGCLEVIRLVVKTYLAHMLSECRQLGENAAQMHDEINVLATFMLVNDKSLRLFPTKSSEYKRFHARMVLLMVMADCKDCLEALVKKGLDTSKLPCDKLGSELFYDLECQCSDEQRKLLGIDLPHQTTSPIDYGYETP